MGTAAALGAEIVEELDALEPLAAGWDDLAVRCARPYCLHGWLSAWWRHAAPPDARLQVVVVTEDHQLIGVAPLFLTRERLGLRTLRPMGWPICHDVQPLAASGREPAVAAAVSQALAAGRSPPDLLAFDGIDGGSRWPADLADAWPGGQATLLTRYELPTFSLSLPEGLEYETWFAGKSRSFRKNLGYNRRRFVRRGGRFRMVTPETLEPDLRAFGRLHRGRWERRGGSGYLSDRAERVLAAAGRALVGTGRFRLWSLELDGEVVSSHLALRAGAAYVYWLGGFDERYAVLSPSMLGILALVEDAFACGARGIDFGSGSAEWKVRLADDEGTLAWRRVVPPGRRHAVTRLSLAPGQWRRELSNRLPGEVSAGVLALERRLRGR
jgi:CelD/BcsL family acetyltransferase involved in cellulose biosynthesis